MSRQWKLQGRIWSILRSNFGTSDNIIMQPGGRVSQPACSPIVTQMRWYNGEGKKQRNNHGWDEWWIGPPWTHEERGKRSELSFCFCQLRPYDTIILIYSYLNGVILDYDYLLLYNYVYSLSVTVTPVRLTIRLQWQFFCNRKDLLLKIIG